MVTDTYTFEGFGNPLATTGTTVNPYKYIAGSGYYADGESGLMLLTFRYYDTALGRFITPDPTSVGPNLYMYANNNPLKYVDPMGLRLMDAGEEAVADSVFLLDNGIRLIDYGKVKIDTTSKRSRVICFFRPALVIHDKIFARSDHHLKYLLIHELTHIWQYENNLLTVKSGIWAHAKDLVRLFSSIYDYDLFEDKPFEQFGFEQQAQILHDYYYVVIKGREPSEHYKPESKQNATKKERNDKYKDRLAEFRKYAIGLKK